MNYPDNVVSIHPYFKVHPGKLAEFKAALPACIEKTRGEPDNLYYEFTINGDEVFCREAYAGAELDQMRAPMAQMNPAWFIRETGK